MRIFLKVFFLLLAATVALQGHAADITALRSWRAPDNTRIVLDLTGPVKYRLSADSTPARLIVEIDDVQLQGPLGLSTISGPLKSLHFEKNGPGQRLIIDTTLELMPKIFQLPPNEKYGQRLVLDLYEKPVAMTPSQVAAVVTEKAAVDAGKVLSPKPVMPEPGPTKAEKAEDVAAAARALSGEVPSVPAVVSHEPEKTLPLPVARPAEKKPVEKTAELPALKTAEPAREKFDGKRYRNIVVAIDAGHGGEDPGASGQKGSHEKNITLAIARELEAQLQSEPGITAVLTRTGDYFIPLQDRRRIARYQHKADIFVSIHADAAENRSAKGASVFALSLKGAGTATSRFARMLAERENRSDLIGGAALENSDDVLRNVLADMVVAGSLEHSLRMGRNIIGNLDAVGSLHSRNVEQAGFAVLKEPGMVSVLVETGFISNPDEEDRLNSKPYQHEIAKAVFNGVRRYCVQYPAPGTYFAWLSERDRDRPVLAASAAGAKKNTAVTKADASVPGAASPAAAIDVPPAFVRHRVVRGENLTGLAEQYRVSMNTLREVNRLQDDNVKIGQVLKIPAH
ncbi:MAG: N-acetylmuramoyl-L-alanine amidase [bacterium]|nr:N-acetylmuramoyl-L-alanine amidase [bacterium]